MPEPKHNIPTYYAAAASGGIGAFSGVFMDRFAVNAITNTTFTTTNNFVDSKINETEFDITTQELVFDIIITEILIYLFDPTAKADYENHYFERHHLAHEHERTNKTIWQTIFIVVITNTYFSFKNSSKSRQAG